MKDDFERDPLIGRALGDLEGPTPLDRVDWKSLQQRIVAGAAPELRRLARTLAWWEYAAKWARVAVPVGVAAILGLILWLFPGKGTGPGQEHRLNNKDALAMVVTGEATEAEMINLVLDSPAGEPILLGFPED